MAKLMGNLVATYFDANANRVKTVMLDNDNFVPHDKPHLLRVTLTKAAYAALPQTLNFAGRAEPHGLAQAVLSQVTAANASIGAKLAAKIAATQTVIDAKAAADLVALLAPVEIDIGLP